MSFLTKIELSLSKKLNKPVSNYRINAANITPQDALFTAVKKGNKEWFEFGPKDGTPIYLEDLAANSAVHNAILKTKAMMVSGDGVLVNGAEYTGNSGDLKTGSELRYILNNEFGGIDYQYFKNVISDNYCVHGAFAYVVTWNRDFTKIASYKPILTKYLRASVPEDGGKVVKYYYYEGDWSKVRVSDKAVKTYYVYDKTDKDHYDQIIYDKDGGEPVYGVPTYRGGLTWINIGIQMGVFHDSNIRNGMNPGLHFKFYTQPKTEEEKQSIIDQIKYNWMGALNTGRFVPTFSPNRELATDVVPIETSNLDKQLLNLTELCDRQVLSSHQLTSPLLAGISVSGQLGANIELKTAFTLWNKVIIAKMQQRIDNSLQKHIFDVNLKGQKIETKPFNPLEGIV